MTDSLLKQTLKLLFRNPIVIVLYGDWRQGKTDTSLLLAKLGLKWGILGRVASNIWTYNNPEISYIFRMSKLKQWMFSDKSTKLYILDEALKYAYRRKAMSKSNVALITELLPELSKGHVRLIVNSQILKLDSDLIDPAFTRAVFKKLSKKVMVCRSKHWIGTRTFEDLPRSPIRFDKDRIAPFIIDKSMSIAENDAQKETLFQIVSSYRKGMSFRQIQANTGLHPEEIRRGIRKALKWFEQNYEGGLKFKPKIPEVPQRDFVDSD